MGRGGARAIFERLHVGRILVRHETPDVAFEPLPVAGGYEDRPTSSFSAPWCCASPARTAVNPDAPPDKTLQKIVIGRAAPPPRFKGFCDAMQSNGREILVRRIAAPESTLTWRR